MVTVRRKVKSYLVTLQMMPEVRHPHLKGVQSSTGSCMSLSPLISGLGWWEGAKGKQASMAYNQDPQRAAKREEKGKPGTVKTGAVKTRQMLAAKTWGRGQKLWAASPAMV